MSSQDELILRPSKMSMALFFIFCFAFTIIGGLMIHVGRRSGWFVAGVFGFGSLVFFLQLLPNCSFLELGPDGFTVRSLYRSHQYGWADVDHFAVTRVGVNKMVAFDFSSGYEKGQTARRMATNISGYEGALPDSYGMKPEQLSELMSEWKARHCDERRVT
jgi:hypothetical protein